ETSQICKSHLYVDSRQGVLEKGGEVVQAIAKGLIDSKHILADLGEMVANPAHFSRDDKKATTVFKSVGFAALDLIAVELILESMSSF
ncbi:MAG: ornithine cyclodeaminase, partial [Burkholderiales bacterium PBB4]